MPTVPAIAESGVGDFDVSIWFGLLAPTGTAAHVVRKIHDFLVTVLAMQALPVRLSAAALDPITMRPAEFGETLRRDVSKWATVVKQAKLIRFE